MSIGKEIPVDISAIKYSDMHIDAFTIEIKDKSDKLMDYFLVGFFVIGLLLSFFYDTWTIGVGVGSLSLIAYYSVKFLLPYSSLYQYVLSAVIGIFMAQYIYQMHGLFEMHFIAFIGSAILITYQNWKLQIPLAIVVLLHHSIFGYLQYIGFSKIYFTQLDYMGLQTFTIHILLSIGIFYICGLWAYHFKKYSTTYIEQTFDMSRLKEESLQKESILLKRMSEELKIANNQLNEAQKMSHIGNLIWDIKNNSVYGSDEICNIFERTKSELNTTYEGYFEYLHPDDREYVQSLVENCLINQKQFSCDARIIIPDNKIKTIFVHGKVILDESGDIAQVHATLQDITAQQKHEQELLQTNDQLRKSNEELDKFVYSVSHDLRAPLLSMQGIVEITSEASSEDMTITHMKMLKESIARLDDFIQEILTYSRNARGEIKCTQINFEGVMNELIQDLQFMGNDVKKVKIILSIHQNSDFYTDKGRFKVIMNNLISNAIRYCNPEIAEPFVKIRGYSIGTTFLFEVEDNGIGIPAESHQKIFDMFYRVSEMSDGSGLGLYIVKETIDKLKGEISFDSTPGIGTKFTVKIPNLILNN